MTPTLLDTFNQLDPTVYPRACEPLEEVGAAEPADVGAAFAFALDRVTSGDDPRPDPRPWVLVTPPTWVRERGRPFARGLAFGRFTPERLIWVRADKEASALWALEEALKSGAVAGGLVCAEQAAFVVTRRLDFAARAGGARGVLLRIGTAGDLSAARRRWRIGSAVSGEAPFDAKAPGPTRIRAELTRRRDGPPGHWILEQDDETGGFGVVAGLADHGLEKTGSQPRRSA